MSNPSLSSDWSRRLTAVSSQAVFATFVRMIPDLDDRSFWEALSYTWTMDSSPWQDEDMYRGMFSSPKPGREALMNERDRAALTALPATVAIYRGFTHDGREVGLSWTTERKVAEFFACRFAVLDLGQPRVAQGTIDRDRILAYFRDRNEAEVIALSEDVTIDSVDAVSCPEWEDGG